MSQCKWSTDTCRNWVTGMTHCSVIECRNPKALEDFDAFGKINQVGIVRRACDANFSLIPDPDCVHVRSGYCNANDCPLFEAEN